MLSLVLDLPCIFFKCIAHFPLPPFNVCHASAPLFPFDLLWLQKSWRVEWRPSAGQATHFMHSAELSSCLTRLMFDGGSDVEPPSPLSSSSQSPPQSVHKV